MKKYKSILGLLVMVCSLVSSGFQSHIAHAAVNSTQSIATPASIVLVADTVTTKSSSDSIKVLQAALNQALGPQFKITVAVNGTWTTKTTSAIKTFQSWSGLNPTGKVDLSTSTNLNISLLTSQ